MDLNLVDVTLGREFWTSRYLSFRPKVALRYSHIDQGNHIEYKGGSFVRAFDNQQPDEAEPLSDEVDLQNRFEGVGVLAGFDTNWHLGCGWALYGDLASSIVYGRFDIDHDEYVRQTQSPFTKSRILETQDHFRASRAMLDLALGVQYSTLICDCKYGIEAQLGWEQHLFFHQNQLWRVNRKAGSLNNEGVNDHEQRRGTLSTQGWTLSFRFDF